MRIILCTGLAAIAIGGCGFSSEPTETAWPSSRQAAFIATTPIDTGFREEDEQPAFTRALANAGWDFNPNCDDINDWYPVGDPCNRRS